MESKKEEGGRSGESKTKKVVITGRKRNVEEVVRSALVGEYEVKAVYNKVEAFAHCFRSKEEVRLRNLEVAGVLSLTGILKSPRMIVGNSEERK